MRTGPVVHGALLAAALGVGWQTWTRDREEKPAAATVTVWPGGAPVDGLTIAGKLRDVTVEKKDGEGGSYLWATVKKRTPPPVKPEGAAAAPDDQVSQPGDLGTTTTTQFPVGEDGEKALARLAPLVALRDLGKTPGDDFGLGNDSDKQQLTVTMGGAARQLAVGGSVFGGDERYVLDPASGHIYVVAGEVLRAFDAPEVTLRERKLHSFAPGDVAEAVVRAAGKERTLVKLAAAAAPPQQWADAKAPDKPDQTLANFMERVDQLVPTEYGPAPATLQPVGTVEYRAKGGKVLGTVELTKVAAATAGQFDYYVKSGRTRGQAKVNALAAARVDHDLAELLK